MMNLRGEIVKIFDFAKRKKHGSRIIRAERYEDLPVNVQKAINEVKRDVNRPLPKRKISSSTKHNYVKPNFGESIRRILLDK